MSDNFDNSGINFDDMGIDSVVVLTDENGQDVRFEFLDLVEYQGEEYVVLYPLDDDSGEVVILQIVSESDDEETYAGVESDEILQAVFAIFKEKYSDEFDFVDED